jgi:hypothetical protein
MDPSLVVPAKKVRLAGWQRCSLCVIVSSRTLPLTRSLRLKTDSRAAPKRASRTNICKRELQRAWNYRSRQYIDSAFIIHIVKQCRLDKIAKQQSCQLVFPHVSGLKEECICGIIEPGCSGNNQLQTHNRVSVSENDVRRAELTSKSSSLER